MVLAIGAYAPVVYISSLLPCLITTVGSIMLLHMHELKPNVLCGSFNTLEIDQGREERISFCYHIIFSLLFRNLYCF